MEVGTHASEAIELRKDSSGGMVKRDWTQEREGKTSSYTVLHSVCNSDPESLINYYI